jgi:hypothetical protein
MKLTPLSLVDGPCKPVLASYDGPVYVGNMSCPALNVGLPVVKLSGGLSVRFVGGK